MRTFDYSPFYRATVGFDRMFNLLDSVAGQGNANGYPPYNIEKAGDNAYKIVMAVAGFAEAELNVTQKENELLVTGQAAPNGQDEKQYLYRGIAGRNFERRFQLADHVKVTGAKLYASDFRAADKAPQLEFSSGGEPVRNDWFDHTDETFFAGIVKLPPKPRE